MKNFISKANESVSISSDNINEIKKYIQKNQLWLLIFSTLFFLFFIELSMSLIGFRNLVEVQRFLSLFMIIIYFIPALFFSVLFLKIWLTGREILKLPEITIGSFLVYFKMFNFLLKSIGIYGILLFLFTYFSTFVSFY